MLGVFSQQGIETALRLKDEGEITWESFQDQSCQPSALMQYGVSRRPANFLIDPSGIVQHVNVFEPEVLKSHIESLIDRSLRRSLTQKKHGE